MTNLLSLIAVGMTALLLCCGGTSSTSPPTSVASDAAGPQDATADVVISERFTHLELRDLLTPGQCQTSSAAGADIDAAKLYADPSLSTVVATLTGCAWIADAPAACPGNAHEDERAAEGAPDATPVDGYVSLDGSAIVCRLSGDAAIAPGRVLEVLEVGAAQLPEPFRVRACTSAERVRCGPWLDTQGGVTIPAGKLLP